MKNLKEWAIEYAQKGLAVFPLCERDKRPTTRNGFKDATTDLNQISEWWKQNPNYNIGIATGTISGGLVVIDVDQDSSKGKDGFASITAWMREHGKVNTTAEVNTGRGGLHLYYRTDKQFGNRTNLLKNVDVRADGGYVVAPPSIHPNGKPYLWNAEGYGWEYGIQTAGQTVIDLLNYSPNQNQQSFKVEGDVIPDGMRTDTLFKLTCSLIDKGLSENAIKASVRAENDSRCNPPLTDKELEQNVFTAFKRGYQPTHSYQSNGVEPSRTEQNEVKQEVVLPSIVNFGSIYGHIPQVRPVLIDGVLRQGHKMIISSGSKAGKSYLLINLAVMIAEGWRWIGHQCTQGKVLYINMEIDHASFCNRVESIYKALGLNTMSNRSNIDIWTLRGYSMPLDSLIQQMGDIKEKGYSAIIIDPLYKVMQGDENSNSDIAKMVTGFDKIANDTGASVIYAHHYAKGYAGDKQVIDRASGAGVFARDPDAIISLSEIDIPEDETKLHTAWRVEYVLREFKSPDPTDIWFDFPLHKVDGKGYLENFDLKTGESEKRKRRETAKQKKEESDVKEAFENITFDSDGAFYLADFMEEAGIEVKHTARAILKRNGCFSKPQGAGKPSKWYRH